MNEDILLETIERDCPFCNKVHNLEYYKGQTKGLIKGETVEYEEFYCLCPLTDPDDELGNTFYPDGLLDKTLLNARDAYRKKHGQP